MKIVELTGYRNHPIYQIAQNSNDLYEFEQNMKKAGYKKHIMGSGLFGVVFEKPGTDFVYKLFDVNDDGYMTYLSFVRQHQNSIHVPRASKPIKLKIGDINAYLVKLERLSETDLSNSIHEEQYNKISAILYSLKLMKSGSRIMDAAQYLRKMRHTDPDLLKILKEIDELLTYEMDMHPDNVMMRGNVPVIIDPYVGT